MTDKRHEFLKALAHMLECDAQKVVPEAGLSTLGEWDSLAVMGAVVAIDEVYGKVVHGRALAECHTVADVLRVAEGA